MSQQTEDRRIALLPDGATEFLVRRAAEGVGIVLALAGTLFALALISFESTDPNWNHAVAGGTSNWIGVPGAYVSDFALQTLGVGAALAPLMLISWAWRTFSHRGLARVWLRLTSAPFALLLLAAFASSWPEPAAWPLHSGLGGVLGDFLVARMLLLAAVAVPGAPFAVWQTALALPALFAAVLALGLGSEDWRGLAAALLRTLGRVARALWRGLAYVVRMARGLPVEALRAEPRLSQAPPGDVPARKARTVHVRPPSRDEAATRVGQRAQALKKSPRAKRDVQPALDLGVAGEFRLPSLSLLQSVPGGRRGLALNEFALEQNARLLEIVLGEFGVRGEIAEVNPGPVVTRYELDPAPGVKTARVIGLADDIARSMSAVSARVSVIPGQNRIGIELPNAERETVYLRELLSTPAYEATAGRLSLALGKNIAGEPVVTDLSRMPHLLIAGTTGSGKSVAVNTMILSLLYRLTPDQCRLIMIDPKMLELSAYDGIPHLLSPVVTEPGKAVTALKWVVREMHNRYRSMSRLGVRNLGGYNQRVAEALEAGETPKRTVQTGYDPGTGKPLYEEQELDLRPMPYIVVVVDEMADLMMVAGKDVEGAIQRLSQMARAAGIHLIMATQRPSVDVITGTIKANFPTRVSFQVTSKIDSRTILGEQGAEQLLGQGDMLLMETGGRIQRVHAPFVSEQEIERVVHALKKQGVPDYLEEVTEEPDTEFDAGVASGEGDELYDEAVALVLRERRASTSFIQRHLQVGYNRAARMIERMEVAGLVSAPDRGGKREVLTGDGG